jgi:UDPglucose 6-dehydrogenase
LCVDKDDAKIAMLERGEMPIYEPGLSALVIREERLAFTSGLAAAVRGEAGAVLIAVGTSRGDDGQADLNFVYRTAERISAASKISWLSSTKSTGACRNR